MFVKSQCCGNCLFAEEFVDNEGMKDYRMCKRFPPSIPSPFVGVRDSRQSVAYILLYPLCLHPRVEARDWCGSWDSAEMMSIKEHNAREAIARNKIKSTENK